MKNANRETIGALMAQLSYEETAEFVRWCISKFKSNSKATTNAGSSLSKSIDSINRQSLGL